MPAWFPLLQKTCRALSAGWRTHAGVPPSSEGAGPPSPHTPPASPLWEPLAERMHPGRALGEGRPRLLRGDCSREDHPKCPSDVKRGVQVDQAQRAEPSGSAALGAGRAGAPRCRAQQAEPPDLPQQVPSLQPLQRGVSIHPLAGSSQLALVFSCAATQSYLKLIFTKVKCKKNL